MWLTIMMMMMMMMNEDHHHYVVERVARWDMIDIQKIFDASVMFMLPPF